MITTHARLFSSTINKMSTILISGSNQGVGYWACKVLLDKKTPPSHIIMAVRSTDKGEKARDEFLSYYKSNHKEASSTPKISVLKLNLSDLASVKAFPDALRSAGVETLDTVILNAAINRLERVLTEDGHEEVLQVNYLSTALLSLSLLPFLTAAGVTRPTHLSFVGSQMHHFPTRSIIGFDRPEGILKYLDSDQAIKNVTASEKLNNMPRYAASKLLLTHFTRSLSERINKDEVIINHSCPGVIKGTNNDALLPWWMKPGVYAYRAAFGLTGRTGGKNIVDAAEWGPESHGRWVREGKLVPDMETAKDDEVREKVWKETMQWVATVDPKLEM